MSYNLSVSEDSSFNRCIPEMVSTESYKLSVSDDSSFNRRSREMVSTDTIDYPFMFDLPFSPLYDFDYPLTFDLPFSPLYDSSSGCNLQALVSSSQNQQNPVDETTHADQLVSGLLPSSPPTDQLENLSLFQTTEFPSLSFCPDLENGYENFSSLNCLEVKNNEECQVDFDSAYCDVNENVAKYLQRSFSGNSFEGKPNISFKPPFDSLMESQNFQGQALSMPVTSFMAGQMWKVWSTGDLENIRNLHTNQSSSISAPLAMENSFMEKAHFKVGRYNPEERQERISKYRAKRNQRNFNKTIKYPCRKTLADNRRRIRGRFVSYDETPEIPKVACSTRDEDEHNLRALHEVADETERNLYM